MSRKLKPEQKQRSFRALVHGHRPERGLYWEPSRHNRDGHERGWWVYRPLQPDENGKRLRVRIPGEKGSPSFQEALRHAKYGRQGQAVAAPAKTLAKLTRNDPNSLQWLIDAYIAWMAPKTGKGFADNTKKQHRTILTHVGLKHGSQPFRLISSKDIIDLRDAIAAKDAKTMANKTIAILETLYDWAASPEASKVLEGKLVQVNPCVGVKRIERSDEEESHHPWTVAEQQTWERHFKIGTRGRIIYELMQTGMACVDACAAGPDDLFTNPKGELCIATKRQKTKKAFTVPVTPSLKAAIDAGPCGKRTFFGAEKTGEELDPHYVSAWVAETCDEIGIPDCTAHGLRHTAITRALEKGAREHNLMALFGLSIAVAAKYVKSFNDKRAAEGSAHLFDRDIA
jgi:integrase